MGLNSSDSSGTNKCFGVMEPLQSQSVLVALVLHLLGAALARDAGSAASSSRSRCVNRGGIPARSDAERGPASG